MTIRADIANWTDANPVVLDCKESILSAAKRMAEMKVGAALITEKGKLAGIFTERDLLKFLSSHNISELEQPLEKYMTKNPVCAQKKDDFNTVHMKMKVHNVRHIPIMDRDKLTGIVSIRDMLHYYESKMEADLIERKREIEQLQKLVKLADNEKIKALAGKVEKLEELSLTDFLTGLYNVRYFHSRLQEEISRSQRSGRSLSLIFFDIDYFKKINDTYGHLCGDEILKGIAKILIKELDELNTVSRLRKSDIIARYGGEEFIAILPETTKETAFKVAERMRKGIEKQSFLFHDALVKITMSFGVAEFPKDAKDNAELIKNADYAMYKAKNNGRNIVELY